MNAVKAFSPRTYLNITDELEDVPVIITRTEPSREEMIQRQRSILNNRPIDANEAITEGDRIIFRNIAESSISHVQKGNPKMIIPNNKIVTYNNSFNLNSTVEDPLSASRAKNNPVVRSAPSDTIKKSVNVRSKQADERSEVNRINLRVKHNKNNTETTKVSSRRNIDYRSNASNYIKNHINVSSSTIKSGRNKRVKVTGISGGYLGNKIKVNAKPIITSRRTHHDYATDTRSHIRNRKTRSEAPISTRNERNIININPVVKHKKQIKINHAPFHSSIQKGRVDAPVRIIDRGNIRTTNVSSGRVSNVRKQVNINSNARTRDKITVRQSVNQSKPYRENISIATPASRVRRYNRTESGPEIAVIPNSRNVGNVDNIRTIGNSVVSNLYTRIMSGN